MIPILRGIYGLRVLMNDFGYCLVCGNGACGDGLHALDGFRRSRETSHLIASYDGQNSLINFRHDKSFPGQ